MHSVDPSCIDGCFLGAALDGMCVGLVMVDDAGKIAWVNRAAGSILGLEEGSRGTPFRSQLRDPQLADFWHRSQGQPGVVTDEVSIHWPEPAELKVNSTRCYARDGAPLGHVLLFCDVTADHTAQLALSREATQRLLDVANQWQIAEPAAPNAGLTPQELRVLRHVGSGEGNQQIARSIGVAPATIRSHLKNIYKKLGLSSRSQVVAYAIRNGLS